MATLANGWASSIASCPWMPEPLRVAVFKARPGGRGTDCCARPARGRNPASGHRAPSGGPGRNRAAAFRAGQRAGWMAGMPAILEMPECRLIRPLLAERKARLAATCVLAGMPWVEDRSNLSSGFARGRLRQAGELMVTEGLSLSNLAHASRRAGNPAGIHGAAGGGSSRRLRHMPAARFRHPHACRVAATAARIAAQGDRGGGPYDRSGRVPASLRRRIHPRGRSRRSRLSAGDPWRLSTGAQGRNVDHPARNPSDAPAAASGTGRMEAVGSMAGQVANRKPPCRRWVMFTSWICRQDRAQGRGAVAGLQRRRGPCRGARAWLLA